MAPCLVSAGIKAKGGWNLRMGRRFHPLEGLRHELGTLPDAGYESNFNVTQS